MEKFLTKNKKYIGLILIAAIAFNFFNFLFLPLTALAQPTTPKDADAASSVGELLSWIPGKIFLFVSSLISAGLVALFGLIISLEAQIIDYILSPANFSFTNAPIVTLGWGITRDFANMFFILILLIIAFATVLKIQSYAIKQLWWKVLTAALLINFSLVIAGFVIDFSQVLTTFLINQAIGGEGSITSRLASNMQILNFFNPAPPTSIGGGITQLGASSFAAMIGPILTLIGLVITVFVFGAAAIFLIVRILYIWFLLIVAPIVWMLWILPVTSNHFAKWWDKFIQWTFFAPIYVFMIYLSLSIFDTNGQLNTGVFPANSSAAWMTPTPGLTTVGMPQAIFQWILVIAMMFGSLIVAQKFGGKGAGAITKMVKGATEGAAKSSALWGIKSYGRLATGLGTAMAGVGATRSPAVRIVLAPIRGVGTGLKALGGVATGAKGGVITAPLKSTLNNPLKALAQAAMKGSGLWKTDIKDWQCTFHPAVQVRSKKKPIFACPQVASPPAHIATPASWVEV